jgi:oxygen-independent coproporphyrinogen III oxidase
MALGLYLHVPFCRTRCHFCAFYLHIHRDDRAHRYLTSLKREIRLHRESGTLEERALDTIYVGGGTPTTLQPDQLCRVLDGLQDTFGVERDMEITVEAHPDSVTDSGLEQLARSGVNRLSFGVQSLDEGELVRLGRHQGDRGDRTLPRALAMARRAGILNINLDLMYGLPGQSLEKWLATLDETLGLEPTHLSCYALTIEEGTRFQVDLHRGAEVEPDPSLQIAMEEVAADRLARAGFERYEISNYSRPGFACRHNLGYWEGADYLGLGPSAQSYLNGCRFGNVADLEAYHQALEADRLPLVDREQLDAGQRRRERIVFGLRLSRGIAAEADQSNLANSGAGPPDPRWADSILQLTQQGLLEETAGTLRLTPLGRRYADSVAVALL